jgi:hypothetical protein
MVFRQVFFLFCSASGDGRGFGAPPPGSTLQDVSMMEKAVEHSRDGRDIAQEFAPVFHGAIGGQQGAGTFVAAHDDLQ